MKFYSWNVYYHNRTLDRAFRYIENLDFDVLCLQEVPQEFLDRLAGLGCHIASAVDVTLSSSRGAQTLYTVIVSRFPFRTTGVFPMPELIVPWRVFALARVYLFFQAQDIWTGLSGRQILYADVELPHGVTRVFSLHITLSSPRDRKKEFAEVEKLIPSTMPAVIAGDFNILEHPFVKTLHWFTGAPVAESGPWHRERAHVEKRFSSWRLVNPLKGKVTHGFSQSQLDHVLVPNTWKVLAAAVIQQKHGSDHRPVMVEAAPE